MDFQRLRLNRPERRQQLVQEFYEHHHSTSRDIGAAKDMERKVRFFRAFLDEFLAGRPAASAKPAGVDLGCRGGALTTQLGQDVDWIGVDIDRNAIELANRQGLPCEEMDFATAIDFVDQAFDVVVLTEVLEHLPYPTVSVAEVHRILRPGGAFMGSVPLDYHLHRRLAVLRGRRLTGDPTHLHHFSFAELDGLLRARFHQVRYEPLRGTAARHPGWGLSFHHFVRDIAWVAWEPREENRPVVSGAAGGKQT
jgi:SAM-dependent methyltransferase